MKNYDLIVIGGGIVGLATAFRMSQRLPDARIAILEKENQVGRHQSGHNSGVLHTGIYYRPGSFRASQCRHGKQALERFCVEEGIPFERCGKVIVARDDAELPALHKIYERGLANGVNCRLITPAELAEIEPHAPGAGAVHVPEAGIIDYDQVCAKLASRLEHAGVSIVTDAQVLGIGERASEVIVDSTAGLFTARQLIGCAGLYSDRLARMSGARSEVKIVPFRGEYYQLRAEADHLCRGLIYPVPDPRFPFLGVHFTRQIGGGVECGPNAVLALAREGYRWRDVNVADLWAVLSYRGFRRLAGVYWRTGIGEMWRSASKRAFVTALQKLVPDIRAEHLHPAPSGVRAQAVTPDGKLLDDFAFAETARTLHVVNAASPAATACLAVGDHIADQVVPRLQT